MARTGQDAGDGVEERGLGVLERTLAYVFVALIVISVAAFIILMLGSAGGWIGEATYGLVLAVPFIGLPLALVIIVVLVVMSGSRRSRANRRR